MVHYSSEHGSENRENTPDNRQKAIEVKEEKGAGTVTAEPPERNSDRVSQVKVEDKVGEECRGNDEATSKTDTLEKMEIDDVNIEFESTIKVEEDIRLKSDEKVPPIHKEVKTEGEKIQSDQKPEKVGLMVASQPPKSKIGEEPLRGGPSSKPHEVVKKGQIQLLPILKKRPKAIEVIDLDDSDDDDDVVYDGSTDKFNTSEEFVGGDVTVEEDMFAEKKAKPRANDLRKFRRGKK